MAFISSETIKAKREKIKAEFPSSKGWKFSIKGRHHSVIEVVILASPFNLVSEDRICITYLHQNGISQFKDRPVYKSLLRIVEIVDEGNFDKSDIMTDYFHVGFYKTIEIGSYGVPCIWNKQSIKAEV